VNFHLTTLVSLEVARPSCLTHYPITGGARPYQAMRSVFVRAVQLEKKWRFSPFVPRPDGFLVLLLGRLFRRSFLMVYVWENIRCEAAFYTSSARY
jgi:hypothetical protein